MTDKSCTCDCHSTLIGRYEEIVEELLMVIHASNSKRKMTHFNNFKYYCGVCIFKTDDKKELSDHIRWEVHSNYKEKTLGGAVMTQQIVLFPNISIAENLSKVETIEYLKKYCIIDNLGDTIYAKKPGNDKTTFAIDYTFNKISVVRKIKDSQGNIINVILFESPRCRCDEPCYDETESQCIICGEYLD